VPVVNGRVHVTFNPSGVTIEARTGRQLLAVIRESGLPIGYSCRGQGVCTACAVRVKGKTNPIEEQERRLLRRLADIEENDSGALRIACLVHVEDDLFVRADYW
jgi:ferredoxin